MHIEYIGSIRSLSALARSLKPPTRGNLPREQTPLELAIAEALPGQRIRVSHFIGNRAIFLNGTAWQAETDQAGNLIPGTVQPYVSGLPACAARGPFDDDDLRSDAI